MPYRYQIDPSQQLAVITFSGEVTIETLLDAMLAFISDDAWRPELDRILDWRSATGVSLRPDEMKAYAARAQSTGALFTGRVAVVSADALHATMRELYAAPVSWPLRLFTSMDEALAWLGRQWPEAPAEGRY